MHKGHFTKYLPVNKRCSNESFCLGNIDQDTGECDGDVVGTSCADNKMCCPEDWTVCPGFSNQPDQPNQLPDRDFCCDQPSCADIEVCIDGSIVDISVCCPPDRIANFDISPCGTVRMCCGAKVVQGWCCGDSLATNICFDANGGPSCCRGPCCEPEDGRDRPCCREDQCCVDGKCVDSCYSETETITLPCDECPGPEEVPCQTCEDEGDECTTADGEPYNPEDEDGDSGNGMCYFTPPCDQEEDGGGDGDGDGDDPPVCSYEETTYHCCDTGSCMVCEDGQCKSDCKVGCEECDPECEEDCKCVSTCESCDECVEDPESCPEGSPDDCELTYKCEDCEDRYPNQCMECTEEGCAPSCDENCEICSEEGSCVPNPDTEDDPECKCSGCDNVDDDEMAEGDGTVDCPEECDPTPTPSEGESGT